MPVISPTELEACIGALRYQAQNEAGHSQAPNLFTREDTDEWELADKLQKRLDRCQERPKRVDRK